MPSWSAGESPNLCRGIGRMVVGVMRKVGRTFREASAHGFPWETAAAGQDTGTRLRSAGREALLARRPALQRAVLAAWMTLSWPVASLTRSIRYARLVRPRARCGRTRAGLACAAWRAALTQSFPPPEFFLWHAWRPGAPRLGEWMLSADTAALLRELTDPGTRTLIADKAAFARFCEARGLPVAGTIAEILADGAALPALPECDLVSKPRYGSAGRGLAFWCWDGARHRDGPTVLAPAGLARRAARQGPLLIQRRILPDPALAAPGAGGVPVLRVITGRWPDGRAVACSATLQWPAPGSLRNNGPIRLVDLGRGMVMGPVPAQSCPVLSDPPCENVPDARPLDGVGELLPRLVAAHEALPGRAPALAWDLALSDEGPVVLEANTGISFFFDQWLTGRPASETLLGRIVAAALP